MYISKNGQASYSHFSSLFNSVLQFKFHHLLQIYNIQSGFSKPTFFKLKFEKKIEFSLYRDALWPSCRKAPVDCVFTLIECDNAPLELDKWKGFGNWWRAKFSRFCRWQVSCCNQELVHANEKKSWWRLLLHYT